MDNDLLKASYIAALIELVRNKWKHHGEIDTALMDRIERLLDLGFGAESEPADAALVAERRVE